MGLKEAFAAGDYLTVAAGEPAGVEERLLVASALYRLGREREALRHFGAVEQELENLARGLLIAARLHLDQGNAGAATRLLERYLAFFPDDDEARDLLEGGADRDGELVAVASPELARIYAQQGHYAQALGIYAQVLPQDASVRDEALKTQNLFVVKTLEGWLERLRNDENPDC
jgi:tetratricopeptide (TPR) repeat protein